MVKKSIDAKVRPLANTINLEKASLHGASRVYVSKDSLLALTNSLEGGNLCLLEKLEGDALPAREATLWIQGEKNLSPNVVAMTRAFQEATGLKIGDQVRITLAPGPVPAAEQVVVADLTEEDRSVVGGAKYAPCWEYSLSLSMQRAGDVFPGMVLDGVNINKLKRTFKVLSVNARANNIAKFQLASTTLRILPPGAPLEPPPPAQPRGELLIQAVPALSKQIRTLNRFLRGFARPFWLKDERESCGFVIHGGHSTGKTLILRRVEETRWGSTFWVKPSDKLSAMREMFRAARALQPSILLIDGLDEITGKDRSNRDAVIEVLAEELDALSSEAQKLGALPQVVVLATCLDYMSDVPAKLQKRSRFRENIALPIPRAPERLEILSFLDPPIRLEEKAECLASIAQKTHAYNGDDLATLVLNAKRILGNRLDEAAVPTTPGSEHRLTGDDMEQALRVTRPTAMHDINLKPPTIYWQDVGGQESLKKVLNRMIKLSKDSNPISRQVLHHPPKGLLLYGPPGCSKTLSAQAMATESGFNFFAVKGAELLNMYVGESERAVRSLFERARAAAPAIIFFDEIDSIGGQRGSGGSAATAAAAKSSGAVNMLTTLLTEMDGFEALTGVLVLAATNRPEVIDPALLRPGRFDQVLYVGPPDEPAREAVLRVHLRGLALAPDVDVAALARRADGFSGAELKALCNEAGLAALDRLEHGEGCGPLRIEMADLLDAMERTPRNITRAMLEGYEAWRRQFKRV